MLLSKLLAQLKRTRPVLLAGGLLGLFGACIPLSQGHMYANLRVSGKLPANTLVAENSNTCTVSAETFANVRVGDNHRCVWVAPNTRRVGTN